MLKKRTRSLIERIDRNIKIGFGVIVLLTLFFVVDDFYLTPHFSDEISYSVPSWIYVTDALTILFLVGTFLYFNVRYRSVKRSYSLTNDLRQVLEGITSILNSYRKLFYMAIGWLLFVIAVSFITGMLSGYEIAAETQGGSIHDLIDSQVRNTIIAGILIVLALTTFLFLLFRWVFRKLYGNYIQKLKDTLKELDEIE